MVELILRELWDFILRIRVELARMLGATKGTGPIDGLPLHTGLVAGWHSVSWVEERRPSEIIVTSFPNTLCLQVLRSIRWSSHSFRFQRCAPLNILVLVISEVRQSMSRRQDSSSMRGVHISLRISSASSDIASLHRVGLLVDPLAPAIII